MAIGALFEGCFNDISISQRSDTDAHYHLECGVSYLLASRLRYFLSNKLPPILTPNKLFARLELP